MGVLSIRPQLTEEALDYSAEVGRLRLNEDGIVHLPVLCRSI
ncbi:MAG: hypothetical protein QOH78_1818 [Verrucomicrobiota bacterium]|jgi:hypothetical protein